MDKITITRLSENNGYSAKVTTYNETTCIEATAGDPVESVASLLLELQSVQVRYQNIPSNHLSYEGKRLLELATETIEGLRLQDPILKLEISG